MRPTNYAHGHYAERVAADYLVRLNFNIVGTNWKTKWCEIDIIAQKNGVMYFSEVKYRKTTNQGAGLDYITPKKLQQMRFAAELWVNDHDWKGEYQLAALELTGQSFDITAFITDI